MAGGVVRAQKNGSRRRRHGRAQPMAEINITPFVDVMLVLLIIFMVAAPLLTVGVPVELHKTAANALPPEKTRAVDGDDYGTGCGDDPENRNCDQRLGAKA